MPEQSEEDRYERRTGTFSNVSGDGTTASDSDLVVLEVTHQAQLTNLRITGATSELYDVVVRDQDGSNATTVASFVGSDLDEGDFEDPAYRKIGAGREVAVVNETGLTDDNYAVNVTLHEIESETTP